MKNKSTTLCPFLLSALVAILPNSAQAHPGHGLTEGGAVHWMTSPDHLATLAVVGLAALCVGVFFKDRPYGKVLKYGGLASVAVAAVLRGFGS